MTADTDPAYALQIALAAQLLAYAPLTDLIGQNVFDDLSAPASLYDRVCIGDDQIVGDSDTNADPSIVYCTLHIWCNGPAGRLRAKQIAKAIRACLRTRFALDGHKMTSVRLDTSHYLADVDSTVPDGRVAHGVLTFRFTTCPLK